MKVEYAVNIIEAAIKDESGFSPFSSGTDACMWMAENCESCKKALICYDPEGYENMRDGGREETLDGRNCFGEYAIACGFITGKIPEEISIWMGGTENELPSQCRFFSDNDNDRPDRRPPPIPPNQLFLPFLCTSLFGFDDPNILVFDKAIVEKDVFAVPLLHEQRKNNVADEESQRAERRHFECS